MLIQELIRKKRDGESLQEDEISWFMSELTKDNISDSQIAAFAMAIFLKGMTIRERICLTKSMRDSGKRLTWDLSGPIIDKHSTGGVGDCVSLLLAPALAACGGFVPMVSGRGLGHTGGTLDKFDSIPGYNTKPSIDILKNTVKTIGCAIVGQTDELVPADKRLYAVRDVTATIESIDLITSSILSKKLASGLDALVLDIKCGNGAFMGSKKMAIDLANSLVSVGKGLNCDTVAVLTDMNEPLCSTVGNSLEIAKVVNIFSGTEKEKRLLDVVCVLGGTILTQVGLADDENLGYAIIKKSFETGQAAEIFEKMIFSLGGSIDFLRRAKNELPKAPLVKAVYAKSSGYVTHIDTRAIGIAVIELGGARRRSGDRIDYSVGFENLLGIWDRVDHYSPLALIHARDEETLLFAEAIILKAYTIKSKKNKEKTPIIIKKIR